MSRVQTLDIAGYFGGGIEVSVGSTIRLTDIEGQQVADLLALVKSDPGEYLCTARTRALTQRLFPAVDQFFFTNLCRPILKFVSDQTPGVHDSLFVSCDPGLHEKRACKPPRKLVGSNEEARCGRSLCASAGQLLSKYSDKQRQHLGDGNGFNRAG